MASRRILLDIVCHSAWHRSVRGLDDKLEDIMVVQKVVVYVNKEFASNDCDTDSDDLHVTAGELQHGAVEM